MKIVIQTNADFTPKGKRNAKVVKTARGSDQLRWYVSGSIYRQLAPTASNLALTNEWLAA